MLPLRDWKILLCASALVVYVQIIRLYLPEGLWVMFGESYYRYLKRSVGHWRHKIFEVWRWNLRLLVHFGELKTTFPVPILTVAAQETSGGSKPRYFPCLRHRYLRKCRSPTVMTYEIIRPSDSCSHNITMLFSNERVLVGCWWNRELKMRLSWRWLTTDRWLCTNIR